MPMFDPNAGGGSTPNWTGFDPNRTQTRINYLQKVRPKDPEIAKQQALLQQYQASKGNANVGATAGAGGATTNTGGAQGFLMGNPFGQQTLDAFNQYANWSKGNQPNFDNAPKLPGADDFSADRQRIEDQLYGHVAKDLDTRYKTDTDQFEQDMANQGIDIGNPRYEREKELFLRAKNQAYNDARFGAIKDAADQQTQMFTNALDARKQSAAETESLNNQRAVRLATLLNPTMQTQNMMNQNQMNQADLANKLQYQKIQNKWQGGQNSQDRSVQRSQIAKMGGGGGTLDPKVIQDIINKLTG